jgi:hypothetical protein
MIMIRTAALTAILAVGLASGAFIQSVPAVQRDNDELGNAKAPTVEMNKPDKISATSGDSSAVKKSASPNRSQTIHHRRRPHTRAMPRGMSDRQMQLRQQREKSR